MSTTISTSQDFDANTRTAGEAFVISSGAVFTINSDTRYNKNSPASGLGTFSTVDMTNLTGGTLSIDATAVRWLAYNTGTGNVPASGTSITQGGVTGELMNVTSGLGTAPTAAGAAMPASGFIKFKSVTAGPFTAGALTGIGASATGADVTGWIEVVRDTATAITTSRNQKIVSRGAWFYLDNTNGSAGQQIQLPNYGGAGAYHPGVWIETGVATGVYEFWPAQRNVASGGWTTTNKGTDERVRFVEAMANGIIRIGSDGSSNIGYVPASGCRVRIGNVVMAAALAASRASNAFTASIGTMPTVTGSGQYDFEYAFGSWNMTISGAYSFRMVNTALFDCMSITACATPITCSEYHIGNYYNFTALTLANLSGGTVTSCKWGNMGAANISFAMNYCSGITFDSCLFDVRSNRSTGNSTSLTFGWPFMITCHDITVNNCISVGQPFSMTSGSYNVYFTNHKYADSYSNLTNTVNKSWGVMQFIQGATNCIVNGLSWYTSVANVHPCNALVYIAQSTNIRVENIGTRSAPLSGGSVNKMLAAVDMFNLTIGGSSTNISIKRVFVDVATQFMFQKETNSGVLVENCSGGYANVVAVDTASTRPIASNAILKNLAAASWSESASLTGNFFGSIFYSLYTSTTAGILGILFAESSATYATYVTTNFTTSSSGTSSFNSLGKLALVNSGDYVIYEFPYWITGIDGFHNTDPTLTTATNMLAEYQIDTGSGYNGSWKTASGANLSAETIDEVAGFRIKFKISCTSSSASNSLTAFYCITDADTTAQDVQYPLDLYTITVNGLKTGSRVLIAKTSDNSVIFNGLESGGAVSVATTYQGEVKIEARSTTYEPWITINTIGTGLSVTALQTADASTTGTPRGDITVDFTVSPRVLTVASPSTTVDIADLHETICALENTANGILYPSLHTASGGQFLGSGTYVGLTLQLNNAVLSFAARSGPSWTLCTISGGNLVAIDNATPPNNIDPRQPTAYVSVDRAASSSATIAEINDVLTVDNFLALK